MQRLELERKGPRIDIGMQFFGKELSLRFGIGMYTVWHVKPTDNLEKPEEILLVRGIFLSGRQAERKGQEMLRRREGIQSETWLRR